MNRLVIILLLSIVSAGTPVVAAGKDKATPAPPTFSEEEARAMATQAAAIANGDKKKFDNAFRKLARAKAPEYEDGGYSILQYGLRLAVFSRLGAFQDAVWEQIRTLKPIEEAKWPAHEVIVVLTSSLMTDQMIDRIVVNRNGTMIDATESVIVERDAKNLQGAVFRAREGWAGFPLSAFAREKRLRLNLVLIPVSASENITPKVSEFAMRRIHMGGR